MKYQLDSEAARQANSSSNIKDSGKYIGTFTRAEMVTSQKGTKGIEFSFESENKQTADYLTIWTVNKDGNHIYGYNILMAIMTCLKLRDIGTESAVIEKYDSTARKVMPTQATVYPDLMGKKIGVLLQMEEYENSSGELRTRPTLFAVFEAATELVAAEILDKKTTPERLEKMVGQLLPLKTLKPSGGASAAATTSSRTLDDLDDIPF